MPEEGRTQPGKACLRAARFQYCSGLSEVPASLRSEEFFPERVVQENFLEKFLILLLGRRFVWIGKQSQVENCSLAGFAACRDFPAVVMNDKIAGHQTDAEFHRAVAANDKRIENQAQRFFRKARAVVPDLHQDF